MAVEQGLHVVTQNDLNARQVVVTPAEQPVAGEARMSRLVGARAIEWPKKTTVEGATLVVPLTSQAKVGDRIFWTAHS